MCGIALIVSGIRIEELSSFFASNIEPSSQFQQPLFSIEDIKAALRRRGPDRLGSKRIFLQSNGDDLCASEREDELKNDFQDYCDQINNVAELCFIGATLQLRGTSPIVQPLVDASGNILVYNGEIFGGIYVGRDSNDGEVLLESLKNSCSDDDITESNCSGMKQHSVPDILSTINGPWALIYWQACSKTLWFGRDALGRRSLLIHWPSVDDSRLLLSSVSPSCCKYKSSEEGEGSEINFWEELPCGVYSMRLSASKSDVNVNGQVKKHEWANPMLKELIEWERTLIQPKPEDSIIVPPNGFGYIRASIQLPADTLLHVLREAVMRRSAVNTIFKAPKAGDTPEWRAPVAVLFSGGLDSMILAALLDGCLDPKYDIDLLNVSFDSGFAPDRISARAGVNELEKISPLRRWNLVEINAELSKLTSEMNHVMSLINPSKTYMDINIGLALWLAAKGEGYIYDPKVSIYCDEIGPKNYQHSTFKSDSRILLVGSGADEQCAGYGRHRTKYRNASWIGLHEEMKLDMQRIWKRNLGRDDRCIADTGKEARFPFLDEDVIRTLLDFPLWEIADLNQPSGKGDKKILREVAQLLGLHEASSLPKRAIQFGSRIARESNRKNFGSNRAANQASAGSVEVFR